MAQWGAVVTSYKGGEALPRCLLPRQRPSKWAVDKKPVVREIHSIKQAAEFSRTTQSMQQWRELLATLFQHEARVTREPRLCLGEASSASQGVPHELLISGTPRNENHCKSCWYHYIRNQGAVHSGATSTYVTYRRQFELPLMALWKAELGILLSVPTTKSSHYDFFSLSMPSSPGNTSQPHHQNRGRERNKDLFWMCVCGRVRFIHEMQITMCYLHIWRKTNLECKCLEGILFLNMNVAKIIRAFRTPSLFKRFPNKCLKRNFIRITETVTNKQKKIFKH